ncbi:MAG TPA: tripartite tricarboxylate transporter TctB family protein [bacterium]|nr:tripartite tricarboxylate transporter TctB family protein [bacterium]
MRLHTDAKLGLALLAFCGLMLWGTYQIEPRPYISLSAAVFPRVVLTLLIPLCLALFIKGLRESTGLDPRGGITLANIRGTIFKYRTVIGSFVLFFLLVVAMPVLGFLISGALYVAAMLWLLGPRSPRQIPFILMVSIGFAGGIYVVFRFLLFVFVPEGIFF